MKLSDLWFEDGFWKAVWYDESNHYHMQRFLWYTKKEVIYKLRHKYGVKVGREFC